MVDKVYTVTKITEELVFNPSRGIVVFMAVPFQKEDFVPENNINNDLNRDMIAAFRSEYGKAFIGFVNLPIDQLQAMQEGKLIRSLWV